MLEFLLGGPILILMIMAIIQFSLVWAGQGAVETAAHFAARKFSLHARTDFNSAKTLALAEASSLCLHRPGGKWSAASLTSLDFCRNGKGVPSRNAATGDAYCVRLTHWIELIVPWINRILFMIAPVKKVRIGDQYFLLLTATRWVSVE